MPEPESPVIADELVPRQADGDVLEVVLPGAVNDEFLLRHNLRVYASDQTGTCVRSSAGLPSRRPERHTSVRTVAALLVSVAFALQAAVATATARRRTALRRRTFSISESDFTLTPSTVTVDAPGTYTFEAMNDGGVDHALEIEGNGIEEEDGHDRPGESASVTVDLEAGTYEMYCPISNHRDLGMSGEITVSG